MNTSLGQVYLESAIKRLLTYKTLGEGTFAQLEEKDFYFAPVLLTTSSVPAPTAPNWANVGPSANAPVAHSNSIAIIIHHLHGNMMSRWTNFLTEDGEKPGRNRDEEFSPPAGGKTALLALWEQGWTCLLDTLRSLEEKDLLKTITIRHEPLTAIDAINRQLAHYPHHVGQIVYIGKMIRDEAWKSLSIPPGASRQFNQQMQEKHQ
jgi:hypothetical protein